jgi:thiol-disulfide isomerase/thioredoxin
MPRLRPPARAVVACAVLTAVALSVSGCTNVGSTGDQGYIDGKGVITLLPEADRKQPGEVSGKTLEGDELSLSSYAGKVVVVNVWGAWCPPCRAEAEDLAAAARELGPLGVQFVGINTRDSSQDNAQSFQRRYDVPYPSIYDPGGRNLLAFRRTLTPNAIPSTVIIDEEGRVAASIIGEVTSKTTLVDLVEDVSK